jgi:two-component system NarL family response regulator
MGLCTSLEDDPDLAVCAAVGNAPAAVMASVRERPDVCLIDIAIPGGGIEAAAEIASRLREATRIVMLEASGDERWLLASVRVGAVGYLSLNIDPASLCEALRDAFAGKAVISPLLTARLLEELRDRSPHRRSGIGTDPVARLTTREWHVLDLLRYGLTTKAVAERLSLTPATVRSHIASIRRKSSATDRRTVLDAYPAGLARRIVGQVSREEPLKRPKARRKRSPTLTPPPSRERT